MHGPFVTVTFIRLIFHFQLTDEMTQILGLDKNIDFLNSWNVWREKVIKYGRLEKARSGVNEILSKLTDSNDTEGKPDSVAAATTKYKSSIT